MIVRFASLVRRIRASVGCGDFRSRGALIEELLREGYGVDEIQDAFDHIDEGEPVFAAGGRAVGYRFLVEEEALQLTQRAHARFVRMQQRGLIDPFQAEAVASLVRRAAPRRIGLRALNEIIKYVCDGAMDALLLDGHHRSRLLN